MALLSVLGACTRVHETPPDARRPEHIQGAAAPFPHRELPHDWHAFDTRFLHYVSIQVAPEHLDALEHDHEQRIPCDITLNGVSLHNVGIRQKGSLGSGSTLADKPGWSLKFDEFVKGQRYQGLDKLLLNNAHQDRSLLNEHLAYELYRRAGLAAPRTAHALVVLNGRIYGFYVVREAYDKRALRGMFGNGNGNLYEGSCCVDFAAPLGSPALLDLKDEQEEGRTREDLQVLADIVETAPDDTLEQQLEAVLDVDAWLTSYALEVALAHWDGYALNLNNYYLYHRPGDGRFVFLPQGMDQLVDQPELDPFQVPQSRLAQRVLEHPSLKARFLARLHTVVREVWSDEAMQARAEAVHTVIESVPYDDARVREELEDFQARFPLQLELFRGRRILLEGLLPPSGP
ncbi:MAG TPA: CotH kinase family protein [Archangium sp.]|uniref:CotH kinase family protein n=1 Tax=Archangium sp. TaxID=1872627 RepID=UPI002E34A03B|nr:CotH kinase family protein [Archangium sp.]HEX5748679.1 CotH kinase family protein [Archangium sp.]